MHLGNIYTKHKINLMCQYFCTRPVSSNHIKIIKSLINESYDYIFNKKLCILDLFSGKGRMINLFDTDKIVKVVSVESVFSNCMDQKRMYRNLNIKYKVVCMDVIKFKWSPEIFDVIIIDPPYAYPNLLSKSFRVILKNSIMNSKSLIICRTTICNYCNLDIPSVFVVDRKYCKNIHCFLFIKKIFGLN